MVHKIKLISIFSLIIILFGCASTTPVVKKSGKPAWVDNPKGTYPEAAYLYAIGEGSRRQYAEENAVANLSKIFESKVSVDQTVTEQYKELMTKDGGSFSNETTSNQSVNIQSNQTLFNVKFGETYTNNLGQIVVIAYMNRLETGDIYQEKINENAVRIQELLKKAQNSKNAEERYSYLYACDTIASMNQILLGQLDIISSSMKALVELNYDRDDIRKKMSNAASKITFHIKINGDKNNQIKSSLSEILTNEGFNVSNIAIYNVVGTITIEDVDLQRKEKFVRWNLNLDVKSNEKTVLTYQKSGREGHLNKSEAEARAFRKAKTKIEHEIKTKLKQYFQKYNY
jgi:hypothetical protein